jgi:thioredoxin reductase
LKPLRIAILGAGPIGLEAALYAATLGHEVTVLERGRAGENLTRWGHVTLFSPWRMNHTPLGKRVLESTGVRDWPADESYQTGLELLRSYLLPLSTSPLLRGRILEQHQVLAIGKDHLLKGERIADTSRLDSPFRILARSLSGEKIFRADRILDTTGTYGCPNRLGSGGISATGETDAQDRISYDLDDPLGRDRERYAGKRTLLVGCGYSAATSLKAMRRLAAEAAGTSVLWVTRSTEDRPYPILADDPLPGRAALVEEANRIASEGAGSIQRLPGREVESVRSLEDGSLEVHLSTTKGGEHYQVDRILANVGYQPDRALYAELQIHECYASSGPMKLAAALLSQGSADCLSVGGQGAETLLNPEPGFFILGSKSYGRNSTFLLRAGFEQVRDAFRLIQGRNDLDLYVSTETVPA